MNYKAFEQWQDGELNNEQALDTLIGNLSAVEDSLKPLEETRKVIRGQLSFVVNTMGDRVDKPGYGRLENTAPTIGVTYNRAKLDGLIAQLTKEGHTDIAARISACRQESNREGYFKITPQRGDHKVQESEDS